MDRDGGVANEANASAGAPAGGRPAGGVVYLDALRARWARDAMAEFEPVGVTGGPVRAEGLDVCSPDDLGRALADLERVRAQVEAEIARVVDAATVRGVVGDDGHRRPHGWVRAWAGVSAGRSREVVARARLFRFEPWVADALHSGRFTVEHVDELVRAWGNPRVREWFGQFQAEFIEFARDYRFQEFAFLVRHWVTMADADGADQKRVSDHDRRFLTWKLTDGVLRLRGALDGPAAVELNEALKQAVAAERLTDWDAAKAAMGDAACETDLPRSQAQRAIDALHALVTQGFETAPGGKAPKPLVNLVIDWPTVEEWLARAVGDDLANPVGVRQRLCHSIDGDDLSPGEVIAALVEGSVRLVAIDAARNPVAISSVQRCFTPSVIEALRSLSPTCSWPGCCRPASTTDCDHLIPWSEGGATVAANGGPCCDFHNRWRHRHRYRVWKDPTGRFHTYRPDGTEVLAA